MSERAPAEQRERREQFRFAARSLACEDHPSRNEDAYLVDEELGTIGVFDGLGGHQAGQEASATARDAVREGIAMWDDIGDEDAADEEGMKGSLRNVLAAAGRAVVERGQELYLAAPDDVKREWNGIETTASVAKLYRFADGRAVAFIANVGDSRVYVRRADGSLELVTTDHDVLSDPDFVHMLEDKFQRNISEADIARYRTLLDDADGEAGMADELGKALFRMRNRMRATLGSRGGLGTRTASVLLAPGDILFAVSDGVSDNIRHSRIADIAAAARTPDELVERLTHEAYEIAHAGPTKAELNALAREGKPLPRSKRDDITGVAAEVLAV